MKNDERWRIIFAIPIVLAILQIFFFLVVIRQEPVGFSVSNDKDEDAKLLLKRVYKQGKLTD